MSRDKSGVTKVLDGASALGIGAAVDVSDWRHVEMQISSSGSAAFTLKFQISQSADKPDFNSAASATNRWTYVQAKNLDTAATIDGSTGVVFAADAVVNVEINTNLIKWICPKITAYTQGKVFCDLSACNDSLQ